MAPYTRSGRLPLLLIAALAAALGQTPSQPAPQKSQPVHKQAKHSDSNLLEGDKFPISEIVTLLRSVRSGRIKQARLIEAIQARGIAFPPSEFNLARLMNSGAAEPVLEAIEKLNAPPIPAPASVEPNKLLYTMAVTCEPAECETRIGEQEFRETSGGKATFHNLPSGRIILDSKKAGFETKTEIVSLDPANLSPSGLFFHKVALIPTLATQNVWGATLLAAILAKAGIAVDHGVVTGDLTITEPDPTEWGITVQLASNGASSLEVESAKGKAGYLSSAGYWEIKPSRKSPYTGTRAEKAKAESTLLRNMDTWIAYEYSSLMRGLSGSGVEARSPGDPGLPGDGRELEIHTAQGREVIGFNSDLQPSSISIPNATGANTPARVEFSDYRQMGGGMYPGLTVIRFPDSEHHTLTLKASKFDAEGGSPKSSALPLKQ